VNTRPSESPTREIRLVTVDEVCYFKSADKYTTVITRDAELLLSTPLIGQLLENKRFPAHRAAQWFQKWQLENTMHRLVVVLFILMSHAIADEIDSPVGRWKTINEDTNAVESVVQIELKNNELKGKIVSLVDQSNPLCTECKGVQKGQPILGMEILNGFKKNGSTWQGGKILDPSNGEQYNATIAVIDNGSKLKVRGYIGFAIFGRTQVWLRDKAQP